MSIIDVGCYDGWILHQLSNLPFNQMVGIEPREKNIIKGKIKFTVLKRYEESYVVYDTNYEKNITKIRKYFSDNGITLIGRFGFFEYVNIDMALDRVVSILEQKYSQSRESLFSIATKKLKTI